jgi:hypothetical protein
VREPGDLTFPIISRLVDDIAVVDDEDIAGTILMLLERSKQMVEGAGAVGLAAIRSLLTPSEPVPPQAGPVVQAPELPGLSDLVDEHPRPRAPAGRRSEERRRARVRRFGQARAGRPRRPVDQRELARPGR